MSNLQLVKRFFAGDTSGNILNQNIVAVTCLDHAVTAETGDVIISHEVFWLVARGALAN